MCEQVLSKPYVKISGLKILLVRIRRPKCTVPTVYMKTVQSDRHYL
jgi:hypothetical protein